MLKVAIAIIAGGMMATASAFLGLSLNKSNEDGTSGITQGELAMQTAGGRPLIELEVLPPTEPGACANIRFSTSAFVPVNLGVFNREGKRVRTLIQKFLPAGTYQIAWYGESELPRALKPGVYFAVLSTGAQMLREKLAYLRSESE